MNICNTQAEFLLSLEWAQDWPVRAYLLLKMRFLGCANAKGPLHTDEAAVVSPSPAGNMGW